MQSLISNDDRPDATWSLEKLERYALDRADAIHGFGRKTILQTWLFGESLSLIREITKKDGGWMKWVETQPFSLSTATAAVKLSERVSFDALSKFDGMTLTDIKAALDIIQLPIKKRQQNTSTPETTSAQNAEAASSTQDATVATNAPSDPEASAEQSGNADAPEPKTTTTDYSKSNGKPTTKPGVGVTLTAAEVLGQALNMIIEAEKLGIDADCTDILTKLSEKVAALSQPTQVSVAA